MGPLCKKKQVKSYGWLLQFLNRAQELNYRDECYRLYIL